MSTPTTVLISIQQPVHAWQIPADGVETLRRRFPHVTFIHATDAETRARGLAVCDVAYTWILNAEELAAAPALKWLHSSAVAVETLAIPELIARGIIVSNSRGVQATPIAEHVLAVMLAFSKQLPFVLAEQGARRWSQNDFAGDRQPWVLRGRTLGLIGIGTIGSEVARLAGAFGMRVIAVRRRPDAPSVDGLTLVADLETLLGESDALVIAAPLTPETHQLINRTRLLQMKRGAVLINVGRARIVDHEALVGVLESGHLSGASLDVFHREPLPPDDPLWRAPNVILTPHTSGFRRGHWDDVVELFADNLARYLRGEPLRFRVDPGLGY